MSGRTLAAVSVVIALGTVACGTETPDGVAATQSTPAGHDVLLRGRGGFYVFPGPNDIGSINISNPSDTPGECISEDFEGQMTVTDGSGDTIGLVSFEQPGSWEGDDCIYEATVSLPSTDFYIFTMDGLEGELKLTESDLSAGALTFETYNSLLTEAAPF